MTDWSELQLTIGEDEPDDRVLGDLSRATGLALLNKSLRCGTAESCTGGMVAMLLTDSAGSSDWFDRGYVTYSNRAKHEMLGVPNPLFESVGAVSKEVVLAMSDGVLSRARQHEGVQDGVQIATAISGVAGPGGGTPEKPVGTVWIAWALTDAIRHTMRYQFTGDRDRIRRMAARQALRGIIVCTEMV